MGFACDCDKDGMSRREILHRMVIEELDKVLDKMNFDDGGTIDLYLVPSGASFDVKCTGKSAGDWDGIAWMGNG